MSRFEILVIAFCGLFFIGHVLFAGARFCTAQDQGSRLEALGLLVPGFAGAIIVFAFLSPWPLLRPISALVSLPLIVVGRPLYELVVFRRRGGIGHNQK